MHFIFIRLSVWIPTRNAVLFRRQLKLQTLDVWASLYIPTSNRIRAWIMLKRDVGFFLFFFFISPSPVPIYFSCCRECCNFAATLFHCKAPEIFCRLWNFTRLPIGQEWVDNERVSNFGWTYPLMLCRLTSDRGHAVSCHISCCTLHNAMCVPCLLDGLHPFVALTLFLGPQF